MKTMSGYTRVIPRDLFNEARLLKCLGRLALLIHDGAAGVRGLTLEHDDTEASGFEIHQDDSSGALYCRNLNCYCAGRLIGLRAAYNSKDAYPLWFALDDTDGGAFDGRVFDESGEPTQEFRDLLNALLERKGLGPIAPL